MIRHVLRMVTPAVVLILIWVLPAFAAYEAGKSAWDEMRPAEAFREWRAAAKERDAPADKMTARQVASARERARLWRLVGEERKKSSSSRPASPVREALGRWFVAWVDAASAAEVPCEGWNTESFFKRAGAGDVARCLKAGADVNAQDKKGETPLHLAAANNSNPAVIAALLKADAALNARNEWGYVPLHYAARWNKNIEVAAALLKAGADPKARSEYDKTPLHLAARNNSNPAVVAALLKAGADPNARYWWDNTPLHDAARNKNPAVAAALIKAGADANARDKQGETPLHDAATNKNPAVITALLKAGADPGARNKQGHIPLHFAAASNKNPVVAAALIEAGADPGARDKWGNTPLHFAVGNAPLYFAVETNKNPDVITAFLKAGADPNERNEKGSTPLHWAVDSGNLAALAALLKAGASPKARDEYGNTPLHLAVANNSNPDVAAALLKAGADPNARDKKGGTPLHWAVDSGNLAALAALLKAGTDPKTRDEYGNTPLHLAAAKNNNPAVAAALLKAGADPNARDKEGRTPLHRAARFNTNPALAVVSALLKAGADPNARDELGHTPRRYAIRSKNRAVSAALGKAGRNTKSGTPLLGATENDQRWKTQGIIFRDCPDCPEMVVVPSGSFVMGSPSGERGRRSNEGPRHRVTIPKPFAVGKYEVTFAEWDACATEGGCIFHRGGYRPDDEGWGRGRRPVINVSWDLAKAYVKWLSRKTGKEYRLPSEAEWEYAARAGTTGPFHFGSTISTSQANYNGKFTYGGGSEGVYRKKTMPVGSYPANAFGLHDMHGNVQEWVEDCWNENYRGAPSDGSAWRSGYCLTCVLRGGSLRSRPRFLRSAIRSRAYIGLWDRYMGLRVARTLSP